MGRFTSRVVDRSLDNFFRVNSVSPPILFTREGYEHISVTQPALTNVHSFPAVLLFTHQTVPILLPELAQVRFRARPFGRNQLTSNHPPTRVGQDVAIEFVMDMHHSPVSTPRNLL